MKLRSVLIGVAALCAAASTPSVARAAEDFPEGFVQFVRCPGGGTHPQVEMSDSGMLHVVYFKGDPAAGDLFYVTSEDNAESFSDPIRVNSGAGSVDFSKSARGARMDVDRRGRVHVTWIAAAGAVADLPDESRALLYSRKVQRDGGFETERVLSGQFHGLDAAPSVLEAWRKIFVFWHAPGETTAVASEGEPGRRIYMVVSTDVGETFSDPRAVDTGQQGVSAGCGIAASAQAVSPLVVLYRGRDRRERDILFLRSEDKGVTFKSVMCDNFIGRKSPRDKVVLERRPGKLFAAWCSYGSVWWAPIDDGKRHVPSKPRAKATRWLGRPAIATSERDATVVVWVEGSAAEQPDMIAWQGFDSVRRVSIGLGKQRGIATDVEPAVFVCSDSNGFRILY